MNLYFDIISKLLTTQILIYENPKIWNLNSYINITWNIYIWFCFSHLDAKGSAAYTCACCCFRWRKPLRMNSKQLCTAMPHAKDHPYTKLKTSCVILCGATWHVCCCKNYVAYPHVLQMFRHQWPDTTRHSKVRHGAHHFISGANWRSTWNVT